MTNSRYYCEVITKHLLTNASFEARGAVSPSPAALLLERGTEWTRRTPGRWRGTPQACYANAQHLAKLHGLRYAEGYATSVIPVEHAWCIDEQGRVVDPTWSEKYQPDYFGMIFDTEQVRAIRKIIGRDSYSLLFTWWKWGEVYDFLKETKQHEN